MVPRFEDRRPTSVLETTCLVVFAVGVVSVPGSRSWVGWPNASTQGLLAGLILLLVLSRKSFSRTLALVGALALCLFGAGSMPRFLRLLDLSDGLGGREAGAAAVVVVANFVLLSLATERVASWWGSRGDQRQKRHDG